MKKKVLSESVVKDIFRKTRKKYSAERKILIVIDSTFNLYRREGISVRHYD